MSKVVAVRYGEFGISHVKLNSGEVMTVEQAISAAKQGAIDNVLVGATAGDENKETLRSWPDTSREQRTNLADMPRF